MRKVLTAAAAIALIGATSYADLQNVEVGGGIRIRGNSYDSLGAVGSHNDTEVSNQYTEQRTRLNVTADFSDEVSAFIEMDFYDVWGSDTRDTLGGAGSVGTNSDMQLYQAYITLGQAWGSNFDIKVGRQEVQLGSEFLIGNNDTAGFYTGLSFDGITAVYNADSFNVTLLSLKEAEGDAGSLVSDSDSDMYGIYGSYTGIENMVIDGYVLHNRLGVPTADNLDITTFGARVAGDWNALDYEAEVAIQSGDGPANTDNKGTAINTEVGYTFDTAHAIRIFGGVTMLEGPDGNDNGFNRLYSDWEYSEFLGNGDIGNMDIYRLGGSIQATEKIGLTLIASMFELNEDAGGEDEVGNEIGLYMTYAYSEDVAIEVGAATFLNGDAIEDLNGANEDDPIYVYGEISLSF